MKATRRHWSRRSSSGAPRLALLAIALTVVTNGALRPASAAAQEAVRVAGVVTDEGTGAPVEGAAVRLADPTGSVRETLTGPQGAFAFEAVPPGAYALGVRRIGYEVLSTPLEVGPDARSLDVRLTPQAIPLDPLEVDVEGRPPRLSESGFYDRMDEGWGTFFEPEWIEANKAGFVRLADFMSRLQNRAPLSRCTSVPVYLDRRPVGRADAWGTSRARSINPEGTYRSAAGPPPTLLDELSVHDLGAAELYQPGAKMPLWAWNPATMTCGVIILWSNWTAATTEMPTIDVTLCEPAGRPGEVALEGFVEDRITEVRLPAAHVVASYPTPGGLERVETVVRTDSLGRYRLCDLPAAAEVELAAAYGPHGSDAILVRAAEGGAVMLGVPVTPPGSIAGVVIHGGTGRPLRRVPIELVGTDFGAVANGPEGFLLQGLPPGSYRVRASCSGFDQAEQTVELTEGGQIRVELMLEPRNRRVRRCGT